MTKSKVLKVCALIMFLSGVVILFSTLFPMAEYIAQSKREYPDLLQPVVLDKENRSGLVSAQSDYTKASNWFVGARETDFNRKEIKHYKLTVPKLRVENATVSIGGEDLADSLIQYPGTAKPGQIGNTVIFGHSILPIFYDPENYLAIFSTLNKLESGDEIFVHADNATYKYEVYEKFEVKPEDVEVMDQDENGRFMSLITCTPPGHPAKPKRLVVRAKIVPV